MSEDPGLVELARLPYRQRRELLEAPEEQSDPLRQVTALRRARPDLSAGLVSAVIAQRGYAQRARQTGSLPPGGPWLTTSVGLEQASRPEVAEHRADRLAAAGIVSVVDACAGIGMDARAFAARGLAVVAIEHDPVTAEVCRANLEQAAEADPARARVQCADATDGSVISDAIATLDAPVAVFFDPARRSVVRPVDGSRSRAERDPQLWSPPWSFVEQVRDRLEGLGLVAVKTPPGFTPDATWHAEWVAVGNTVVECALYSPGVSALTPDVGTRRATILGTAGAWTLDFDGDDTPPPARGSRSFLAEVHPVARRQGAIARICAASPDLSPVTEHSMWLSADAPEPIGPALRWFEVLGSASLKDARALCREHRIDRVALKTVESRRPNEAIRASIGLPDGDDHALVAIAGLDELVLVRRMRPT